MSWRIEAEMGYGGAPYRNGFRFATKEEAEEYGNLYARGAHSFEALESPDPVTHRLAGRILETVDAGSN